MSSSSSDEESVVNSYSLTHTWNATPQPSGIKLEADSTSSASFRNGDDSSLNREETKSTSTESSSGEESKSNSGHSKRNKSKTPKKLLLDRSSNNSDDSSSHREETKITLTYSSSDDKSESDSDDFEGNKSKDQEELQSDSEYGKEHLRSYLQLHRYDQGRGGEHGISHANLTVGMHESSSRNSSSGSGQGTMFETNQCTSKSDFGRNTGKHSAFFNAGKVQRAAHSISSSDAEDSDIGGTPGNQTIHFKKSVSGTDNSEEDSPQSHRSKRHPTKSSKAKSQGSSRSSLTESTTTLQADRGVTLLHSVFQYSELRNPKESLLADDDIASGDEVWLVQCPKSIDLLSLKNQTIVLGGNSNMQVGNGSVSKRFSVCSEQCDTHSVNCVLQSRSTEQFKMVSLPVKGTVLIKEHVHVPKLKALNPSQLETVPLPIGLKIRHPLLGLEFEEHIALAKIALQNSQKIAVRGKRRFDRVQSQTLTVSDYSGGDNNYLFDMLPERAQKRKRSCIDSSGGDGVDGSVDSTVLHVKKKKYRHSKEGVQGNSPLIDSEENLIEVPKSNSYPLPNKLHSNHDDSQNIKMKLNKVPKVKNRVPGSSNSSTANASKMGLSVSIKAESRKLRKQKLMSEHSTLNTCPRQMLDSSVCGEMSNEIVGKKSIKHEYPKVKKEKFESQDLSIHVTNACHESLSKKRGKVHKSHKHVSVPSDIAPFLQGGIPSTSMLHVPRVDKAPVRSGDLSPHVFSSSEPSEYGSIKHKKHKKSKGSSTRAEISSGSLLEASHAALWHTPQTDEVSINNNEVLASETNPWHVRESKKLKKNRMTEGDHCRVHIGSGTSSIVMWNVPQTDVAGGNSNHKLERRNGKKKSGVRELTLLSPAAIKQESRSEDS